MKLARVRLTKKRKPEDVLAFVRYRVPCCGKKTIEMIGARQWSHELLQKKCPWCAEHYQLSTVKAA